MDLNVFLQLIDQFSLGHLTTEGFHPISEQLSFQAKQDLPLAIKNFQSIDHLALQKMEQYWDQLFYLSRDINKVLDAGNKVFLVGCGATGRLALTLEKIYSQQFPGKIISFMAGGDYALIKSVESFEDEASYGPRQLNECGYCSDDLVIGITEAGETSFVIGSVLHAAQMPGPSPWILFCNDEKDLMQLERCREYIEHPNVKKLSMNIGPMALSGSTRLQASTVQMLGVGLAFEFLAYDQKSFRTKAQEFVASLKKLDYLMLAPIIEKESELYQQGHNFTYVCDSEYAISILTDTTERSPTFNLLPFETVADSFRARCYLAIKGTSEADVAWSSLLGRKPRALNWKELNGKINLEKVLAFDISENAIARRGAETFEIDIKQNKLNMRLGDVDLSFELASNFTLYKHLAIKLLLNCHSTLVMGRLERYENNVMTWVRPSNFKLIDRATRYVLEILKHKNCVAQYNDVASKVIENANLTNESVVLKVVDLVIAETKH